MTWQGWTLDLTIAACFVVAAPWFHRTQHGLLALALFAGPLLLRAAVAHWKGETDG